MKPPYELNNTILKLLTSISEQIGAVNAAHLQRPSPELRKRNKIKTIKASLEIEGNTLTEDQITALMEQKRVIGPEKDILEVLNAIKVYDQLSSFNPNTLTSFLEAHRLLMNGLVKNPGKLRTKSVGIVKGNKVAHVAPPASNLKYLMKNLFRYLKKEDDPVLIKSCVVHYEIEFIHPFIDGNGRMGRLWQTLVLMKTYPVFEFLPFETIIKDRQAAYYRALELCDKEGKSTKFIEFMLSAIHDALTGMLSLQNRNLTAEERIDYFTSMFSGESFTRKDYLNVFTEISTATASRDLKLGVAQSLISKIGDKRMAKYVVSK